LKNRIILNNESTVLFQYLNEGTEEEPWQTLVRIVSLWAESVIQQFKHIQKETVASTSQLTVSRLSRQCGILNISQPYRPPLLILGIALLYFYFTNHSTLTFGMWKMQNKLVCIFTFTDVEEDMNDSDFWIRTTPIEEREVQFPFRSKSNAATVVPRSFRRHTRGVYDECCRKSCTVQEMASYCGRW
jgi:hypothetical protein